jgi:hypothetical protein
LKYITRDIVVIGGTVPLSPFVAGGTGFYLGNANNNNQVQLQTIRTSQATPMMTTGNVQGLQQLVQKQDQTQNPNQNGTFEQMLPFMKKMHPNLSDDQLKALYDQMMGQNGACSNMMGNLNENTQ